MRDIENCPETLDDRLLASICALNPELLAGVSPDRIAAILDSLTVESEICAVIDPYKNLAEREVGEKAATFQQLGEALLDRSPTVMSYGIHEPSYMQSLQRLSRRSVLPVNSLLLGALTPQTVYDYSYVTRQTFPDISLHAIDLEGISTVDAYRATGTAFKRGNVLEMPYPSESMDVIQGHYLLDRLRCPPAGCTDSTYIGMMRALFQQSYTTLTPEGLLVLVEPRIPRQKDRFLRAVGVDTDREFAQREINDLYVHTIAEELKSAGFAMVAISRAPALRTRRVMERILFEGNQELSQADFAPRQRAIVIEAVK